MKKKFTVFIELQKYKIIYIKYMYIFKKHFPDCAHIFFDIYIVFLTETY